MVQVFRSRVIDKETASIPHFPDDPAANRCRNGRTTETRTQRTKVLQVLIADISRPVQYYISFYSLIVIAFVYSVEVKGQAVTTVIDLLCHIKSQAAFVRILLIGKRLRIFAAGILAMGYIGLVK